MWVLVYFPSDKSQAVINESQIVGITDGTKGTVGTKVQVQWKDNVLSAIIMKFGSNKAYLGRHHVDTETLTVTSPVPRTSKQKNPVIDKKKREIKTETKILLSAKRKTEAKYNEKLLSQLKDKKKSVTVSSTSSTAKVYNKIDFPVSQNNSGSDSNDEKLPDGELAPSKSSSNGNCVLCKFCQSLKVTPEVIITFEHILAKLKLQLQIQYPDQANTDQFVTKVTDGEKWEIPHWKIPADNKIRLSPNGDVWLDSAQLGIFTINHKNNPKELLRKILKWAVGEKYLINKCALGTRDKEGIDPELFVAVKGYVMKQTGAKETGLNRAVNLMCGRLREKSKENQSLTLKKSRRKARKSKELLSSSASGSKSSNSSSSLQLGRGKHLVSNKMSSTVRTAIDAKFEKKPLGSSQETVDLTSREKVHDLQHKGKFQSMSTMNCSISTSSAGDDTGSKLKRSTISSQSGDFSVLSSGFEEQKHFRTSTPYDKEERRRRRSSECILGRRSSASSFENVSPLQVKKRRLNTTPESASETFHTASRKILSPIQQTKMNNKMLDVTKIPLPDSQNRKQVDENVINLPGREMNSARKNTAGYNCAPPAAPSSTSPTAKNYQPSWGQENYPFSPAAPQATYWSSYDASAHNNMYDPQTSPNGFGNQQPGYSTTWEQQNYGYYHQL